MIELVAGWFAKPLVKYGAILLAVVALIGSGLWLYNSIYSKGQKAGESLVIEGVQTKTIEATEKARQTKERIDEEVRQTPYGDRADGLR